MRKFLPIFLIVLFLVACSNTKALTNDADATISVAQLTDLEKALVDLSTSESFLFDLSINNDGLTEIVTAVDYYENGKHVKTIEESVTTIENLIDHKLLKLLFLVKDDAQKQEWIIATIEDGGYGSSEVVVERNDENELKSSVTSNVANNTPLYKNEKRVVASIVKTNKDAVISRTDFNSEEEFQEAIDYEEVYLISVELR